MYKNKITLVVQGPVHPNSIISIRALSKDFNIIVSTWKTNSRDEKNLDFLLERGDHVTVVSHNIEELRPKTNDAHRFYQFFSALKGILLTDTEYVIKMRSDEYYTDLTKFADAILEFPDKLVTNDIFFRNPSTGENENFIGHPSDHLFGGKTLNIKKMLQICVQDCQELTIDEITAKFSDMKNRSFQIVPEQQIFGSFLLAKNPEFSFQKQTPTIREEFTSLTKENCHLIPSSELGFYCISYTDQGNRRFCFYPDETYYNPAKDLKKL